MIARKIENAVKTLSNIKYHVEPSVWRTMSRALNTILEEAAKVRTLEKKQRSADSAPLPGSQKMDLAEAGELLENIAAALRQAGRSAPKCKTAAASRPKPPLSLVSASEIKK